MNEEYAAVMFEVAVSSGIDPRTMSANDYNQPMSANDYSVSGRG
jgi:hypothetical protein